MNKVKASKVNRLEGKLESGKFASFTVASERVELRQANVMHRKKLSSMPVNNK